MTVSMPSPADEIQLAVKYQRYSGTSKALKRIRDGGAATAPGPVGGGPSSGLRVGGSAGSRLQVPGELVEQLGDDNCVQSEDRNDGAVPAPPHVVRQEATLGKRVAKQAERGRGPTQLGGLGAQRGHDGGNRAECVGPLVFTTV